MQEQAMLLELSTGRRRPMRSTAPVCSSVGKGWDGFLVEEHPPVTAMSTNVALFESAVFIPIDGRIHLEWKSGREAVTKEIAPGQISILPANHPYSVKLRAAGESVVVSLAEKLIALAAADQGVFTAIQPVWVHGVEDALVRELVMSLREEMRSTSVSGERYAHSLASTLAAHIVRRYSTDRLSIPSPSGGLSIVALRRVVHYIHDHLGENLTLGTLAAKANLSTCHFARMFKVSTGISPHRYLLNCRIARAKKLMTQGKGTLAEIALRSGFCDQGHLTRSFRDIVGTTPAAFLRDLAVAGQRG
ncbi:helix-turn-helix domain-containing protein [bacterium]|nr:helix-turn-helix domain-containing protein [bacterium]